MEKSPEDGIPMKIILTGETTKSGIPSVIFLEDVPEFLKDHDVNAEQTLQLFHTLHSKYKMMESSVLFNKKTTKAQIPEIRRTLEALEFLIEKESKAEEITTRFNFADNIFVKAKIVPDRKVCLWLGANVMLEYGYEEGVELLKANLAAAEAKLAAYTADAEYLRDQIITTEVNLARTYNSSVRAEKK